MSRSDIRDDNIDAEDTRYHDDVERTSNGIGSNNDLCIPWFYINLICFVLSVIYLAELLFGFYSLSDSKKLYLLYDFGTTLIWCVEMGQKMMSLSRNIHTYEDQRLDYALAIGEGVIAIYYLCNSAFLLYLWRVKKQRIHPIITNVVINILGYMYLVLEEVMANRKHTPPISNMEEEPLINVEEQPMI